MKHYLKSFMNREAANQITMVAIIGVVNTVVDFGVFNVLRQQLSMSRFWSITIAFTIATVVSYLLNRRYTFRLHDGKVYVREAVQFYAINVIAWGVTLGVVELAEALFGDLTVLGENLAKGAAVVIILLPKFAAYRDVVFGRALADRAATAVDDAPDADPNSASALETPPRQ